MKKVLAIALLATSGYANAGGMVMALDCPSGSAMYEQIDSKNKITAFGKVYGISAGTQRFVNDGKIVVGQHAATEAGEVAGVLASMSDLEEQRAVLAATGHEAETCKITEKMNLR